MRRVDNNSLKGVKRGKYIIFLIFEGVQLVSARYVMTSNNYYLRFQLDYIFYIELLTIRAPIATKVFIVLNHLSSII